ncbi:flagellar protein FlgN [Methylobacterium sp. J-068]|uniref:flagellar protein FlgN n=1 Tax=Methylobacterium sp. J-068 TaxID=2836649 RepID=UPI001FBA85BC|nr:flagellar protein FlgN [Methylobacterium sp. J-068]MCJ2036265.1 flagellar protein FlgN [Methylobacterium sp. J-068]
MLIASLKRLEATVAAETEALLAHRPVDQEAVNRRKSQSLLELTRLTRDLDPRQLEAPVLDQLLRLRGVLERNQDVVGLHLRAVEEISGIVADSIREAESDGTYSGHVRR